MTGKYHTIKDGDCVFILSAAEGVPWQKTWSHPNNETLRKDRDAPGILASGDKLFLPKPERRVEQIATEKRHRFVAKTPMVDIRIHLLDMGLPLKGQPYHVQVDDTRYEGNTSSTDDNGLAIITIPAQTQTALLMVGEADEQDEYELIIGHVDPAELPSGKATRLMNLDLLADRDDDEHIDEAMASFLDQVAEWSIHGDVQLQRLKKEYGS